MTQENQPKRKIKIKGRSAIYIIISALVLAYLIFNMLPERTVFMYAQNYSKLEDVKIYTFKEEEYIYIESSEKINFNHEEGTKVSASTILSDDYKISTDEYLERKIEVINYMLANPSLDTREEVYAMMSDIRNRLSEIDLKIEEAEASDDVQTKRELVETRQSLQHNYEILKEAMQYILTDDASLKALLSQYQNMLGSGNIPLTLGNLNFTIFGYLTYSTDGYENMMNFDNLLSVDSSYLDKIDSTAPIGSANLDKYVIKSSSANKTVLVFSLPLDTAVEGELTVIDKYNSLYASYDIDRTEGGYYTFLYRRIDILNTFPSINIKLKDGTVYTGYLINIQRDDDEKILYVAFKENIKDFLGMRLFNASVEVESYDCFILPKSSVAYDSEGSYVTVLTANSEKVKVRVTVYEESGRDVVLRCADNPDLESGMQVMRRGK